MKKELLFYGDISSKTYLQVLLAAYPYDIDKSLVMSLLDKHPMAHPILTSFIHYFQTTFKIHIQVKDNHETTALQSLFTKMCTLAQLNDSLLYTHQYAFDVSYHISHYSLSHPYAHLPLSQISFVTSVKLHTIPVLSLPSLNKTFTITKESTFIYKDISMDAEAYLAVFLKIEDKCGVIYIAKTYASYVSGLAAMYPICEPTSKYEFMIIFGLKKHHDESTYYYDETSQLYIGLICGNHFMFHFLYLKEMILTLYNTICIKKNDLPIHASMMEVGKAKKGIIFMGESQSGKSEMLDYLGLCCEEKDIPYAYLYDDSGILHNLDNKIVSTGSEVAAFRNMYHHRPESLLQNFHNSLFLKEGAHLKWQIIPLTTHEQTMTFHNIALVCYLNKNTSLKGIHIVRNLADMQSLFLNNENEHAFLAGSFGCFAEKNKCTLLLHEFLTVLFVQNVPIFEIGMPYQPKNPIRLYQQVSKELLNYLNQDISPLDPEK